MSDEVERRLERVYRESGNVEDGLAWAREVMRAQGQPTIRLIEQVIRSVRSLTAISTLLDPMMFLDRSQVAHSLSVTFRQRVSPDDIVSFLRGGDEWMEVPPIHLLMPSPLTQLELRVAAQMERDTREREAEQAVMDVRCPVCIAQPGIACYSDSGFEEHDIGRTHAARRAVLYPSASPTPSACELCIGSGRVVVDNGDREDCPNCGGDA